MRRTVLLAAALSLVVATGARAWTWPATGPVLRPFVFDPASPYAAGQHRGILVGGSPGESVLAPAAGTVSFAGSVPGNGLALTIRTADGYAVTLVHLGSIVVARGAGVSEGQAVGTVGESSGVPAVHLGIGSRRRRRGTSTRSASCPRDSFRLWSHCCRLRLPPRLLRRTRRRPPFPTLLLDRVRRRRPRASRRPRRRLSPSRPRLRPARPPARRRIRPSLPRTLRPSRRRRTSLPLPPSRPRRTSPPLPPTLPRRAQWLRSIRPSLSRRPPSRPRLPRSRRLRRSEPTRPTPWRPPKAPRPRPRLRLP